MINENNTVAARIRRLRLSTLLSQEEFGKELGVSRNVIANIENGRKIPEQNLLRTMTAKYSVSMEWLQTGNSMINVLFTKGIIQKDDPRKAEIFLSMICFLAECTDEELTNIITLLDKYVKYRQKKYCQ